MQGSMFIPLTDRNGIGHMLKTEGFAAQIREESLSDHQTAERAAFINRLMAGAVSRAGYASYLTQYQHVYLSLDYANRSLAAHPKFGAFYDARLERTPAITADLAALPTVDFPVTDAAVAYAQRIEHATSDSPLLVVAHHYTRYLGDLSGGRIIAAKLERDLGLSAQDGLAFYEFDGIDKAPRYKRDYRAQLDSLDLSPADRNAFIDEVRLAYQLNTAIFNSLADVT